MMRKTLMTVSALAIALALPAAAEAQGRGNGHGNDNARAEDGGGRGQGQNEGRGRGRGGDEDNPGRGQDRAERGDGNPGRGSGPGNGQGQSDRAVVVVRDSQDDNNNGHGRGRGQGQDRNGDRAVVVVRDDRSDRDFRDALRDFERRDENGRRDAIREFERRFEGRDIRVVRRPGADDVDFVLVRDRDHGLIDGCPPGLAWRNNDCLPPGQVRQLDRPGYNDWFWDRRDDDYSYRYVDGYVYRTGQDGGLSGWLPVLAGALGLNNVWPQQYNYEPVPQYYSRYYGLGDRYDYRYADGVVYGLSPQTNRIEQVSALLTGQPWTVGQRMPSGYDAYNVPYAYRAQYRDTPQSWYRYNDGYVYQVDPTTQLVQSVIQLLA